MKNLFIIFMLFSVLFILSCREDQGNILLKQDSSKVISKDLAKNIAQRVTTKFLQMGIESGQNFAPVEMPNRTIENQIVILDKNEIPALYVFNYINREGFVVISADERHEPICALVESGTFEADTVPSMLVAWFEATVENIEKVRYENYDNTLRAKSSWIDLFDKTNLMSYIINMNPQPFGGDGNGLFPDPNCCPDCPNFPDCLDDPHIGCGANVNCEPRNPDPCGDWHSHTVGPLLPCQWGQGCTYNEQCPDKDCQNTCWTNESAWTGCVATAVSQVLKYWSHPNQFNYNYGSMPNNEGNSEVQRMMKDVGEEVDMDYGCNSSGAYASDAEEAFTDEFNFSTAELDNVNSSWLISDLDNSRPVILDGCNNRRNRFLGWFYTYSNCHMWVCDGYWKEWNNCYGRMQLHMNWGWNEKFSFNNFNGWYLVNNWAPGTWNFKYSQDFIHNIKP